MKLSVASTQGSKVELGKDIWHLEIPTRGSRYRLAQLDDYSKQKRQDFLWRPGTLLNLHARVSSRTIPGTWGFGFWNDPFALSIGIGGMKRRFPALPNAAWFFHASLENHLSFRDDLPPNGFLAACFSSPQENPIVILPQVILFPLLLIRAYARNFRRKLSRVVQGDAHKLDDVDVTNWNEYSLLWEWDKVVFTVNDRTVYTTSNSPQGPLGAVLWIDNQFAAFKPSGEITAGVLNSDTPAWLELAQVRIIDTNEPHSSSSSHL